MQETTRKCTQTSAEDVNEIGREKTAMLDVQQAAALLHCSSRTVYRMSKCGRMPRPVKFGTLVRWNREAIEQWIADGCPGCQRGGHR